MKKYISLLLVILIAMLFAGCTGEKEPTISESMTPEASTIDVLKEPTTSVISSVAQVSEQWEGMNATFAREDSSQYNNATLMMKYLDNDCILFEFRLMEGSESEDLVMDTIISGVLIIDDNGTGIYETIPDAENPFSIQFTLLEDEQTVVITHEGNLTVSPDGRYCFVEDYIEVSETSAGEILAFLPTAATSLNSNIGAYTINYPDAYIFDWFYSVEAVFNDSGAVLAKFLIAKDLSAVFRVDDDIEPVMIFGSAQSMMDAYVMEVMDIPSVEGYEEDLTGSQDDSYYEPRQLIYVTLDSGAYMMPGTSGQLLAIIPADLPYTLTAKSLDTTVVVVDENQTVTAVGEGETEIKCIVTCEDGTAEISVPICVTNELEYDTVSDSFDFESNLIYSEEYELLGDPGDSLNATDAAKLTFDYAKGNDNIPGEYSDDIQYAMVLVGLEEIEGEECYIYRLEVKESTDTVGAAYAYAYESGNIYMQGYGGQWVII